MRFMSFMVMFVVWFILHLYIVSGKQQGNFSGVICHECESNFLYCEHSSRGHILVQLALALIAKVLTILVLSV